jgi:hypothetical protein
MKKFIVLFLLSLSVPVFGACPIDGSSTACSIASFQNERPLDSAYENPSSKTFEPTPSGLKPAEVTPQKTLRTFGQQESDYSYNSSCQFGVCNQTGAPRLFHNNK